MVIHKLGNARTKTTELGPQGLPGSIPGAGVKFRSHTGH